MKVIMKYTRVIGDKRINLALISELLEEMGCFIYFGSKISVVIDR